MLLDVSLLLLYLCNQAVAAPPGAPAVSLSIVGAGTSKADPVLGATVQLKVACGAADAAAAAAAVTAACPPWVRIDRVDGVADSTPYTHVHDACRSNVQAAAPSPCSRVHSSAAPTES